MQESLAICTVQEMTEFCYGCNSHGQFYHGSIDAVFLLIPCSKSVSNCGYVIPNFLPAFSNMSNAFDIMSSESQFVTDILILAEPKLTVG